MLLRNIEHVECVEPVDPLKLVGPVEPVKPVDETRFHALIKTLSHGGGHVPKCAAWTFTGTFMDVEESYLFFLFTMLAQSLNDNTVSLEKIFDDLCATLVDLSNPSAFANASAVKFIPIIKVLKPNIGAKTAQ